MKPGDKELQKLIADPTKLQAELATSPVAVPRALVIVGERVTDAEAVAGPRTSPAEVQNPLSPLIAEKSDGDAVWAKFAHVSTTPSL